MSACRGLEDVVKIGNTEVMVMGNYLKAREMCKGERRCGSEVKVRDE